MVYLHSKCISSIYEFIIFKLWLGQKMSCNHMLTQISANRRILMAVADVYLMFHSTFVRAKFSKIV